MAAAEARRSRPESRSSRGLSAALGVIAALCLAAAPTRAQQNLTFSEVKLGILAHDVDFLGGKEGGVDINPELIWRSPFSDAWVATLPWYLQWMAQPRPTIGGEFNTSGFTNQGYVGATWTWQLLSNVINPGDGVTFGIFFGPEFNDGQIKATKPNRKSLGSNVLFRESLELGYRITPVFQVSAYIDHVSNAGLARFNQSLNEVGGRFGVRF